MASWEGEQNSFPRVLTGIHSLDWSLFSQVTKDGEIIPGMELRSMYELYGWAGIGKSTVAGFLAACVRPEGKINVADIEFAWEKGHNLSNVEAAGFNGLLRIIPMVDAKGKSRTHEQVIQEAADSLMDDEVNAIILDSIGMLRPLAESENDLGDANMGQRARLVAQWTRRVQNKLRDSELPKICLSVNHRYPIIGGRGTTTPGGNALKYATGVRLLVNTVEELESGSSHVRLTTEKLRHGGARKDRIGNIIIIPNYGVSPQMSTVFDCFERGFAKRESYVKVMEGDGMRNAGRLNDLIEKARQGDTDSFQPFYRALEGVSE